MRKVISTEKGKSFFYEIKDDKVNCIQYETDKHMTGQEIGDILNVSKATISTILKRSIKKIYLLLKKEYKDYSVTKIVAEMACMLNVKTDSEYKKFFRLLPKNIKGKINAEAKEIGYCKN